MSHAVLCWLGLYQMDNTIQLTLLGFNGLSQAMLVAVCSDYSSGRYLKSRNYDLRCLFNVHLVCG